ncbi:hypothetical protein [Halocynthiibacter styelae]|uniref:Uncharacterized protein n=1 Tax=Halocynthiibacter styelae TaxID=2761955 RepID=A0A8J7ISH2_9RHOB|nr:hypothetical protein [Paenihalocynthiibacter styelae]MBI1492139.1 hypothetical protein [Paenihalocynthiibacter styelae]
MEPERLTPSEAALMVELCRYHAQILYISQDGLYGPPHIPESEVVPAGTVLFDHFVSSAELLASVLIESGFAQSGGMGSGTCKLLMSSDQFRFPESDVFPRQNVSHLGSAFYGVFNMYKDSERLGHPTTLKRIFDLLSATGLTEERYGCVEWCEKALDWASRPRHLAKWLRPDDEYLWNIDTLDCYLEEAKLLWQIDT